MISPAALSQQVNSQLSREGGMPDLAPRGRWVRKVVWIGGGCVALFVAARLYRAWSTPAAAAAAAVQSVPVPSVPRSSFSPSRSTQAEAPVTSVRFDYVVGDRAGLVLNGSHYEVSSGDSLGTLSIGMLGRRWVDFSVAGQSQRFHLPLSENGASVVRVRSDAVGLGAVGTKAPRASKNASTADDDRGRVRGQ